MEFCFTVTGQKITMDHCSNGRLFYTKYCQDNCQYKCKCLESHLIQPLNCSHETMNILPGNMHVKHAVEQDQLSMWRQKL